MTGFETTGWRVFPSEPSVLKWVAAAKPVAEQTLCEPAQAHQLDCEGTWFVGVDALPNDALGRIGQGPELAGEALAFLRRRHGAIPDLHRAQLSVTWPGYPRPRRGESDAGFRYRLERDAAHIDGLLPIGPDRRRMVREPHLFVLGLPLNVADPDAAPLVVWEASHAVMSRAFALALHDVPPEQRAHKDVTKAYQAARRTAFERCRRVAVEARPGEVIVLHRHLLHGVAPWVKHAQAEGGKRMIAYFRPIAPGGIGEWLRTEA